MFLSEIKKSYSISIILAVIPCEQTFFKTRFQNRYTFNVKLSSD